MNPVKKISRIQLSHIVSLIIAPPRIRRYLDTLGINKIIAETSDKIKEEIMQIKKEGFGEKPVAPESIRKDAPESVKSKHAEDKARFEEAMKKYNEYTSERYKKLEVAYKFCKILIKLRGLMVKTKRNINQEKEMESYKIILSDKPAPKKEKETEETYKKRVSEFVAPKYVALLGDTDVQDEDALATLINKVKFENKGIELFFKRDEQSKSRVRFNDAAAVALATAMELGIDELLEYGMTETFKAQKKTLQPDHVVSPNVVNCDWYPFFKDLPHFKAISDRQSRKLQWITSRDKEKQKVVMKAKVKAKREGKNFVKPKFEFPTFPESEVNNGYARKVDYKDAGGNDKFYYVWDSIDEDFDQEENDDPNFNFYIQQLCKRIISEKSDGGLNSFLEIKVSTNIKKFCSDLIVDFIARISPLIRILINAMDVKTVDHEIIKNALKIILVSSYPSATGYVELSENHSKLFELIDEKVQLYEAHQTHVNNKEEEEDKSDNVGHTEDPTEAVINTPAEMEVEEQLKAEEAVEPVKVEDPKLQVKRKVRKVKAT